MTALKRCSYYNTAFVRLAKGNTYRLRIRSFHSCCMEYRATRLFYRHRSLATLRLSANIQLTLVSSPAIIPWMSVAWLYLDVLFFSCYPPHIAISHACRSISGGSRNAQPNVLLANYCGYLLLCNKSVAVWLACRIQARKSTGSNRSRDAVE